MRGLIKKVSPLSRFTLPNRKKDSFHLIPLKETRRRLQVNAKTRYSTVHDYVIVGCGSAGSVLANRLSQNGKYRVLALEAGPKDHMWNWKIHMPSALQYNLSNDNYNWYYHTEPQKHVNNRVMYWPRGRVWGGSSSLNALAYVRGHAFDYDRWEAEGAKGWAYANCLPYFKKAQTHQDGEDDYRGGSGPLHVSRGKLDNPLHHAFMTAAQDAGYQYTEDMNGFQQEGVGPMDFTIHKGRRWSTAQAYLRPALKRNNLDAETGAFIFELMFDGTKAAGVRYGKDGQLRQANALKEVIVCGGAINSPQLLLLSGIGDAAELRKVGVNPLLNLPGVGQNLQDHLEVYIQYECKEPVTLYTAVKPWNMLAIGVQWLLTQTGLGATSHLESGGFIRSREGITHPDIQYHFLPSVVHDHGRVNADRHSYQVHVGTMRATSRGYLKLRSNKPRDYPILEPNYLSTKEDVEDMRACIPLTREIMTQPAFDRFRGVELQPGVDVDSDEEIDAFIREKCDTAYHPSCTCKMGDTNDPMTVVDSETRVVGTENLRVVDASIMPSVVSGNLNAPSIMLAEKAADIILGNTPLPASTAPVYKTALDRQR